jgi:hypothetical protein
MNLEQAQACAMWLETINNPARIEAAGAGLFVVIVTREDGSLVAFSDEIISAHAEPSLYDGVHTAAVELC